MIDLLDTLLILNISRSSDNIYYLNRNWFTYNIANITLIYGLQNLFHNMNQHLACDYVTKEKHIILEPYLGTDLFICTKIRTRRKTIPFNCSAANALWK